MAEIKGGYAHVADKFLGSANPHHQIQVTEDTYIIIGNFSTEKDTFTHKIYNIASGLDEKSFLWSIKSFSQNNGSSVYFSSEDSAVIKGDQFLLSQLKSEMGMRFSYALVKKDSLDAFIEAEQNYRVHPPQLHTQEPEQRAYCFDA